MLQKIFVLLTVVMLCLSCQDDENKEQLSVPERTVLVYMVAGNNLYKNAKEDITEMQEVIEKTGGNLLVYLDAPQNSEDALPSLFKIENGEIQKIKQYSEQNSASGEVLQSVINDVIVEFPAMEYGLILWSHGTGWLPEGVFNTLKYENDSKFRSFGLDNDKEMKITELAENLPVKFEFIIFDACLMSNIETLYELRNAANYIIASPTETLVAGFPYKETVPLLFSKNIDYEKIANEYVNYYRNQTSPILMSATLCVVNTQFLKILSQFILQNIENKEIKISDTAQLKSYEYAEPMVYFDLYDILKQNIISENANIQLCQIFSQLIVFYEHTDYLLDILPLQNTAGISIFVFPYFQEELFSDYQQMAWYKDMALFLVK
jgi:hypothetical protein